MTHASPDGNAEATASVVLSTEVQHVGTEWVVSGRVRVGKRIVTETRTIEVVVRREELVIETADVVGLGPDGGNWAGTAFDGPSCPVPVEPAPLTITLHEEYPEVRLTTRAYERTTLLRRLVSTTVPVTSVVRREDVTVDSDHAGRP